MGRPTKGSPNQKSVSASELAQMGRCERLAVFEHRHGSCRTDRQQRDRQRGQLAHDPFEREGLDAMLVPSQRRGRCFIATCVFGECWQTEVLRRFRDEVLRPRTWGRWLIWRYYRVGPRVCVVLQGWPALRKATRVTLGLAAAVLRCRLAQLGERG